MDEARTDPFSEEQGRGYALSGKIMLSAIIVLFFVIILMVCLHLYARWYLLRARRRHVQRARNRRTQLVFYVDPDGAPRAANSASRGLEEAVLKALPVFSFSSETHPDPIECAVCLSEFKEGETGRTLPKCGHSFHVECIDMWFHTHSTCPLCRSPVELPEKSVDLVVESSSEVEEPVVAAASTSSFEGRRGKPMELTGVTIEVPRRNGVGFDQDESAATESPAYRSPMSRMLSFKRILSRDRRGSCSSSCGVELDLERGGSGGGEEAAVATGELSVELNRR